MIMAEQEAKSEDSQEKSKPRSGSSLLIIFIASGVATIFEKGHLLPYVVTYIFVFFMGQLIIDKTPPPARFLVWFGRIVAVLALALTGVWIGPVLLSRLIWPPLAWGLSIFLSFMLIHFIPPVSAQQRKMPLWKWAIFCAGSGLFFGVLHHA
jgi:hypothetical protein